MLAQTPTDRTAAQQRESEAVLLREVAVPAFYAKIAADLGVSPPDAASGQLLLALADIVAPAVGRYFEKKAAQQRDQTAGAIKAAADAAFATAGLAAAPAPAAGAAAFLTVPAVAKAAADYAAGLTKQAADVLAPAAVPGAKPDEDEEEKKKKDAALTAAAAVPAAA